MASPSGAVRRAMSRVLCAGRPLPATVVMVPSASTRRMTWFASSQMKNPPPEIGRTQAGRLSCARVAPPRTLLPVLPGVPLPATVVMLPSASMRRILWLLRSAMRELGRRRPGRPWSDRSGARRWRARYRRSRPGAPGMPAILTRTSVDATSRATM
jgi:hypothetical protein